MNDVGEKLHGTIVAEQKQLVIRKKDRVQDLMEEGQIVTGC